MPPIVLTTLKFLFLALLYLFIARAIRVIYLDLVGPRVPKANKPRTSQRSRRGTPRAVAVAEADKSVRTFTLGEELTIGRTDACQVKLDDTYVSNLHARLFMKDGTWFVEDLGSTNGTYMNRVKVTSPTPIGVGDEVRVGKTIIEVRRS
ncbi:MAG TPA: FHA domain-containing protein [Actinomycetota bacterium]|nr:FHA domain-containing protein [Actinomycetota bacterium]